MNRQKEIDALLKEFLSDEEAIRTYKKMSAAVSLFVEALEAVESDEARYEYLTKGLTSLVLASTSDPKLLVECIYAMVSQMLTVTESKSVN